MTLILKALGALLTYPTAELRAALPELLEVVDHALLVGGRERSALRSLVKEIGEADPIDAESYYVELFDRGRRTSLHLFEHLHGESRDRGQAMVDLRAVYERAGFRLAANELPDYLPAVLEFLSCRPLDEARDMLGDCAHILRAIGETLASRGSRYAAVFAALLHVAGEPGFDPKRAATPVVEDKTLDEEWEEEGVVFGPAAAPSCGTGAPHQSLSTGTAR